MKKTILIIAALMCYLFTMAQQPAIDSNKNPRHPDYSPMIQNSASTKNTNSTNTGYASSPAAGMFKVEIFYPDGKNKTFHMNYYENKCMPIVAGFWEAT